MDLWMAGLVMLCAGLGAGCGSYAWELRGRKKTAAVLERFAPLPAASPLRVLLMHGNDLVAEQTVEKRRRPTRVHYRGFRYDIAEVSEEQAVYRRAV